MDSTPFGNGGSVTMPGASAPDEIEIDRGVHGCVRVVGNS